MPTAKPKLIWTDDFSVNVKIIDQQHRHLVDTLNKLIDLLSNLSSSQDLQLIIDDLVDYKESHFATEEKFFAEYHYPDAGEHIDAHREFGQKLEKLRIQYESDTPAFAFALVDFLENWLIEHLKTMDKKYTQWFNDHGLY